jgi:hypothetical protein
VIDPKAVEEKVEEVEAPPKKDYGPPQKRVRNSNGDFVVTKIVIPDTIIPQAVEEERGSDESEEESEEEQVLEEVKEEVKGELNWSDLILVYSPSEIIEQEGAKEARRRRV